MPHFTKSIAAAAFVTAVALMQPAALAQTLGPEAWIGDPNALASPFGPGDEKGAANRLTPAKTLQALSLVQTGEVVNLAVPLDRTTPAYGWRQFQVIVAQNEGTAHSNNEDIIIGPVNTGTNMDGLAHMGIAGRFYNGFKGDDIQTVAGLKKLGIEKATPIVTRGLLLDIAALKGVDRLGIGYAISVADIEAAMKRQGIASIEEGDAVIFHTGHRKLLEASDRKTFLSGQPGPGIEAARYLAAHKVVAVGGDSGSLEVMPFEKPGLVFPVHQTLLAQNGIYIIENIATERLAAKGWSQFLFIVTPLPMVGSSSSWVSPVAIR